MEELTQIYIEDFLDFNYKNIAFDITGVDKKVLFDRLHKDNVNHLYELEDANYIAISNCDLQGFKSVDDIYIDCVQDHYMLCKLIVIGEEWFYKIIEKERKIPDGLLMW